MLNLTVVTPQKRVLTNVEVEEVLVPAYKGELGILEGHAPLMTTLDTGVLKYKPVGSSEYKKMVLSWGYCKVTPMGVTVLSETCETKEEVDRQRAEQSLKNAEQKLSSQNVDPDQIQKFQRKARRAQARLSL